MTRLLSLAATYRANGNNQQLVNAAAKLAQSYGAHVEAIDFSNLDIPLYQEGRTRTIPEAIARLEAALQDADGIILGAPEHNWSFPAALKNMIDWLSILPSSPLKHKTALLLSATPSKRGGVLGLQQLRVPLSVLGMWVHPQLVAIGNIFETLQNGMLQDASDQRYLETCVQDFVATTTHMAHKQPNEINP